MQEYYCILAMTIIKQDIKNILIKIILLKSSIFYHNIEHMSIYKILHFKEFKKIKYFLYVVYNIKFYILYVDISII